MTQFSSQQSIQKVVGYALKYFSSCGEDLWDCIIEECQKVSSHLFLSTSPSKTSPHSLLIRFLNLLRGLLTTE